MPSYRKELSEINKQEAAQLRAAAEEQRRKKKWAAKLDAEIGPLPQTDQTRALRLSAEPWSKASNLPKPPAYALTSREIFEMLIKHAGRMGATAKALRVGPQTLHRRMKFDTELDSAWTEVSPEFSKPVRGRIPAGPQYLRLCSDDELQSYLRNFNTILR